MFWAYAPCIQLFVFCTVYIYMQSFYKIVCAWSLTSFYTIVCLLWYEFDSKAFLNVYKISSEVEEEHIQNHILSNSVKKKI